MFEYFRQGIREDYRGHMNQFESQDLLSRIIKMDFESGDWSVIYEEPVWVAHVSASPMDADLLKFCQQGKTMRNRIWGMKLDELIPWKIRHGSSADMDPASSMCIPHILRAEDRYCLAAT